ncbi:hypothetical protein EROP_29350 [Erysipelotrichaceae bacterium OPF54]|nr:hypothetical protein EROP_29350 [Erysipelotrichaceae bacterium OPF54]
MILKTRKEMGAFIASLEAYGFTPRLIGEIFRDYEERKKSIDEEYALELYESVVWRVKNEQESYEE